VCESIILRLDSVFEFSTLYKRGCADATTYASYSRDSVSKKDKFELTKVVDFLALSLFLTSFFSRLVMSCPLLRSPAVGTV
jgi:hypothetical protein